jgi:hypothetical protein
VDERNSCNLFIYLFKELEKKMKHKKSLGSFSSEARCTKKKTKKEKKRKYPLNDFVGGKRANKMIRNKINTTHWSQ